MKLARALLTALAFFAWAPHEARADAQISARLGAGVGLAMDSATSRNDVLFDLNAYAEALFGAARPSVVRVGPFLELGTDDFVTAEASGGLALQLPLFAAFPVSLAGGVGFASRHEDRDAPFVQGRFTLGYHPYNYLSHYAYALGFYTEARVDVTRDSIVRVTCGIEIDLEFLIGVPVLFIASQLANGDPDESVSAEPP